MDDYYEKHGAAYFERTVRIDPASFLRPFADRLPAGSTVLDVGCGSGRDMLWLKNKGFGVSGLDRSPGLAGLARAHTGCPVRVGDFRTFDFSSQACDALLLCGCLVHLPPDNFPVVFDHILNALNTPGWVFLSLKAGQGQTADQAGRIFYLWQPKILEKILEKCGLHVLDSSRTVSAAGTGESWLGYVLLRSA